VRELKILEVLSTVDKEQMYEFPRETGEQMKSTVFLHHLNQPFQPSLKIPQTFDSATDCENKIMKMKRGKYEILAINM
jgi:hypothetical protein